MKKMKKIIALAAVATLLGGVVACGKTANSELTQIADEETAKAEETTEAEPITIRVANFSAVVWNAAFDVAYQEGFFDEVFEDDNVTVEIINFGTGPEINEAFLAGEVDAVNGIGDQPIISALQTKDLNVAVASTAVVNGSMGVVVDAKSELSKLEDLKGKSIGVGIGTSAHKSLLLLLDGVGLSSDDLELVNIGGDSAEAALANGEIDAVFASGYQFLTAEERGIGKVIATSKEQPFYSYIEFYIPFLEEHEDLAIKFMQAVKKGEEFIDENPEKGYTDISELHGIDYDQVEFIVSHADYSVGLSDDAIQNLYRTNEFLYNQQLIDSEVEKSVIDEHISDILKKVN